MVIFIFFQFFAIFLLKFKYFGRIPLDQITEFGIVK